MSAERIKGERCERTGLTIPECSCPDCYAQLLVKAGQKDPVLRVTSNSPQRYPRYLVTHSL